MKKILFTICIVFGALIAKGAEINSFIESENNIIIDFTLNDYSVYNKSNSNKIVLHGDKEYNKNEEQYSKFILVESNYSVSMVSQSLSSYDYNETDDFNDSSSDFISIKEHIFRGKKIIQIFIDPIKYNRDLNKVEILENATVEISIDNIDSYPDSQLKQSRTFNQIINNLVENPLDNRDVEYQKPSVLYISDPDVMTSPYLQALVNWRKQQGYETYLVSTNETGNSVTSIKNYITDAYYNWDNPPEYLCFIGDANGSVSVPTYDVAGGSGGWNSAHGESDYPYTLIEGDDLFPEMIVGRISVRSSTELATVVQKIIGYEKLYGGNGDWLSTTTLVGDPYDSGISTVITNQYIEQIMENYGVEEINTQYTGSNFDAFMRDQINSGTLYLNYRGFYGFSNFNTNDVNQLNNGYKLPFISTLTCGVNDFSDDSESVVEALLRAGSVASPAGAVAVVGTSQSYTHTAFNNIVAMGIFEGIYVHEAETAGLALIYGKLALINTYPQNPNDNSNLFASWNNLMGDPLTHLWTKNPKVLDNSHLQVIPQSSDYFDVVVSDEEGRPVNEAIVTLYKNDEYSISSETDEFGRAYFNVDYQELGNVIVTSRCYNCVPSETSFEITNALPDVVLLSDSILIDDSQGNSDSIINPGEIVDLTFSVENLSDENLSSCSIQVSSNYSNIQMINNSAQFDILPANSAVEIDGILMNINNVSLENSNSFSLVANIDCSGVEWALFIPISISYGSASIMLDLVSDQNGNMVLDPGETAQFKVTADNNGYIDLFDIDLNFNYNGALIDIENSELNLDLLPLNTQNNDNLITVIASNNLVNGSIVNIPINISSSNGYSDQLSANIQIGVVSSVDPLGPDEHGYYIYDDGDLSYQWAPAYDWIEIDPDYGGNGTELSINDGGNNLDDSQVYDLPFTFTFYGVDYDQITICSNGWIAFGSTDMTSFRNYPLPGPGGPSPMVAVFWDDLKTTNGGEVLWYYDSIEDYLIIEWSEVRTYTDNDLETFQAILFNSDHLTPTGDDEIKIQFKEFNNTSEGSYPVGNYDGPVVHGQYCSVGIENGYGTVGLEYTFNDEYPISSKILGDESAVFITTRFPAIFSQPSLDISDNMIEVALEPNDNASVDFSITNDGQDGSILNYNIELSPFNDLYSSVDAGGYAWTNSLESQEIYYEWEEVSNDAVSLSFAGNDESTDPISIGFPFTFYDNIYEQLIVNPNGWIGFGEDNDAWNNQPIFSDESPRSAILGFWDDLNPAESQDNEVGEGYVYFDSNSDRCIIWYNNVSHWTSSNRTYDFQIILYKDGTIKMNYRDMGDLEDTDSATIGIVNESGEGHEVVYNDYFVENSQSIAFKGTPIWINYYQTDSNDTSLSVGESNNYYVDIDSYAMLPGQYSASFVINPENMFIQTIPVIFTVLDYSILPGDINFDGSINVLDIVSIMNFVISDDQNPSDLELEAADINGDNVLDVLDIVVIINIILSE